MTDHRAFGPQTRALVEATSSHYGRDPEADFSEAEPLYEEAVIPDPLLALIAERDAALVQRDIAVQLLNAALARAETAEKERDQLLATMATQLNSMLIQQEILSGLLSRALRAEQRLASLGPKPEPAHDPFREFPSDRRRVGG